MFRQISLQFHWPYQVHDPFTISPPSMIRRLEEDLLRHSSLQIAAHILRNGTTGYKNIYPPMLH